jgi:alkanesulfonate monooxygenase SsuD/methylene tetrahydromethanopterin reductase-like flavin-dependent oxidoreductase (luciferase family)
VSGINRPVCGTHPRDRADRYNTLDYWVELAKLLERGKFDALFLADVLGVYDVYRGSPDAAIANAVQVPVNDPLLLIPAMAYVTHNLGFGVTCAVSYEHPYMLARRFSTLDHLTGGRIGWNVVRRRRTAGRRSDGGQRDGFRDALVHRDAGRSHRPLAIHPCLRHPGDRRRRQSESIFFGTQYHPEFTLLVAAGLI